jgi:hypothetical protein
MNLDRNDGISVGVISTVDIFLAFLSQTSHHSHTILDPGSKSDAFRLLHPFASSIFHTSQSYTERRLEASFNFIYAKCAGTVAIEREIIFGFRLKSLNALIFPDTSATLFYVTAS